MIKIHFQGDKITIIGPSDEYSVPAPLGWDEEAVYSAIGEVISEWQPRQRRITSGDIERVKDLFGYPNRVQFEIFEGCCLWSQKLDKDRATLKLWTRDMGKTWGASYEYQGAPVWAHDGLVSPEQAIVPPTLS